MPKYLFKVVAVTLGLMALPAAAASPAGPGASDWTGELSATLLGPLPARPTVDVVIYDDTKDNLAFRQAFLDALARSGYQISENATYVFSFATSVTWQQKRLDELRAEQIRKHPVGPGESTVPVGRETEPWADPESMMFGDRRTTPPLVAPRISNAENDRLDISVTLRDESSGKVVWIADLALPLLDEDRTRIVRSIIGPIIGAIGRNVSHAPFDVK